MEWRKITADIYLSVLGTKWRGMLKRAMYVLVREKNKTTELLLTSSLPTAWLLKDAWEKIISALSYLSRQKNKHNFKHNGIKSGIKASHHGGTPLLVCYLPSSSLRVDE